MKHKPIRIDWDELEVAFTNHDEEIVYYLDLVTGHVVIEGEGEEDDFDDDEEFSANRYVSAPPAPRDDSTRAYVSPITTELKLGWMERFLAEKDNGLTADDNQKLKEALESDDSAEALGAFLRSADEARDIWYLYRSDRMHDHMQAWLDENEVQVIDPPPWN